MKKNSSIISGMVLSTLTFSPMVGWSQTAPGTSAPSGSAIQQDQRRPQGSDASAGRGSAESMRSSSASGQWSQQDVRSVQEALKDKGHDPGPIDGVMGARTQQALRAFQRAQNIQTSGQLDSSTASALGVNLSASGSSTQGSSRGSSGTGSMGSGTSSSSNRDGTTIQPNEGNPKDGGSKSGASKSGSTSGSSSQGSSGTGSTGSGTSSGSNRDSTTIQPQEGNPKDGGSTGKSGSSK